MTRIYRFRKLHGWSAALFVLLAIGWMVATQAGWINQGGDTLKRAQPGLYSVNHFIDGDTIAVNMNGHVESVRFIGIDTPETHKPDTPERFVPSRPSTGGRGAKCARNSS